jgi:pimeloyl-ACP methyl ester carboxylesterase
MRALIVAVHGAGMHAGYFHPQTDPNLSFLDTCHRNGFAVLAPDRPGYGDARDAQLSITEQAACLWSGVRWFREQHDSSTEVILLGHSMGAMVAIAMAAMAPPDSRAGLSISGVGEQYRPERQSQVLPVGDAAPHRVPAEVWWGDPTLSPAATRDPRVAPLVPVSEADRRESKLWPSMAANLAAGCQVPVHIVLADRELWWPAGRAGLDELAALFTSAPWVITEEQRLAAHNVGLGYAAAAYHLRVLAFAEDCLLSRHHNDAARFIR